MPTRADSCSWLEKSSPQIGAQGNLGSLTLAANGSYTYTVADSAVQYLGANDTKVDTFTVTALDGTTKQISFTIHGTDDAPVLTVAATTGPHDPPALTALSSHLSGDHPAHPFNPNSDHHASSHPQIDDIAKGLPQHPADNLPHGVARFADNGSPAVTDDAHPVHPHFDGSQPASFKFADDGSAHPGTGPHDPPALTALSSDLSGDHSAHPFNPNSDHHASSDPEINDIAKALPQHAADNLPHRVAQLADNGSPGVSGDSFKFADNDSVHPGAGPHDPSPLTALSSDLSGDHGPAAPALAQTFNGPGTAVNNTASDHIGKDQFMFGKNFHDTIVDLKPDMIETDQTTIAEIQHLLKNTTLDANAVSTLNSTAPQDMTKVHLSHQGDLHFA
jgi:VCBS repeat-containing protein